MTTGRLPFAFLKNVVSRGAVRAEIGITLKEAQEAEQVDVEALALLQLAGLPRLGHHEDHRNPLLSCCKHDTEHGAWYMYMGIAYT